MTLADRGHLVKKIKQDKNGVYRTVYVNPDAGEHGDEETRMKPRTDARAALQHAIDNKGKLTRAHLDALPEHLKALTKAEKIEVARKLKLHVSDSKAHLMERILAYAKGQKQPKRPEGPDTLYKAVLRSGGIDPKSLAFLAHMSGVSEAIQSGLSLGLFRSRAGTSKDGKRGQGLDGLAQELHNMGYIQQPDTEHLLEQLRKGARGAYNSGSGAADKLFKKAEEENDAAHKWAEENPEASREYDEIRARLEARRAERAKRSHETGNPVPFDDDTPTDEPGANPVKTLAATLTRAEAVDAEAQRARRVAEVFDVITKAARDV